MNPQRGWGVWGVRRCQVGGLGGPEVRDWGVQGGSTPFPGPGYKLAKCRLLLNMSSGRDVNVFRSRRLVGGRPVKIVK